MLTESSDEGITADFEEYKLEDVRREVMELRQKLEQERQLRMVLELRARTLESHHYAEKVHHVTSHLEPQPQMSPAHKMEKVYKFVTKHLTTRSIVMSDL